MGGRHSVVMEEDISNRCCDVLMFTLLCNWLRFPRNNIIRLTQQASPEIGENTETGETSVFML